MIPDQNNKYFSEKQKFDQTWLIALLVVTTILPIAINLAFFVLPYETFDSMGSLVTMIDELIYFVLLGSFTILILFVFKLETYIDQTGLYYRLYPLNRKYHHKTKHDIVEYTSKEYRPIGEFGGWGIRYGNKRTKAYTTSGKKGIFFKLKDGKNLLIGTKKPDEFIKALDRLFNKR
jgi:hypothetical protein